MRIWAVLHSFFSDVDWYIIRFHPKAWHWRLDYFLLSVATSDLLALCLDVRDEVQFSQVLLFSFCVANVWLNISFRESRNVYSGNGFAPLVLATTIAVQPIMLSLAIFKGADVFVGMILIIHFFIVPLYFHKLVIFRLKPRSFSAANLSMTFIITCVGVVMFWLVVKVLNFLDHRERGALLASSAKSTVSKGTIDVDPVGAAFPLMSALRNAIPRLHGNNAEFYLRCFLIAAALLLFMIVSAKPIMRISKWFYRRVAHPIFDVELHRRLLYGPVKGDITEEWIDRLTTYSVAIPALLWLFFVLIPIVISEATTPNLVCWLISVCGTLLVFGFILLQTKSFQPYFNDYRARREPINY